MRFGMISVFIASCASLSWGCNSPLPTHYSVYINPELKNNSAPIIAGLQEWEDTTDVTFSVVIEEHDCEGEQDSICIQGGTGADLTAKYGGGHNILGNDWRFHDFDSVHESLIRIALDKVQGSPVDFQAVVMHEVGHAIGLNHLGDGTVMAPSIKKASMHLTCADKQEYYALRGKKVGCF